MGRKVVSSDPTQIRVRYSDVDRMGLLYHVNYLEYFEVARSDWIRRFWQPYKEIEDSGLSLVVIEANIRYIRSARYDDELEAYVDVTDWGRSRLVFEYRIYQKGDPQLICSGRTSHCFIGRNGIPTKMPEELRALLNEKAEAE